MGFPRMNYNEGDRKSGSARDFGKAFAAISAGQKRGSTSEYQSKENHEGELSRIRDSKGANCVGGHGLDGARRRNDELNGGYRCGG